MFQEILKDTKFKVLITTKAENGLILRDMELFQSFKTTPEILLGLSHVGEVGKGAAHHNIKIANRLHEAGILVKVFITPILPHSKGFIYSNLIGIIHFTAVFLMI